MNTQPFSYDAAVRGLSTSGDYAALEDIGIPTTPEAAKSQYESGKQVAKLLGEAAAMHTIAISSRAATAPGAAEHAQLGKIDPDLIR